MGGGLFKLPYTLGILILLISVISVSYAYFNESETQEQSNVINTKCFEVSMASEGEEITLNEAYPVTDEEGKKQDGYTFTIKNTCNTSATYQINLEEKDLEENIQRLSNEYIKVSLNDSKGKNLNQYEKASTTIKEQDFTSDVSHKLTSGSLKPQEEETYTIKLWMDEETPVKEEVMNATFESKISVVTTYIEEEQLQNNTTIMYEEKEEYSKESESILFTVTSEKEEVKIIEYSLDGKIYEPIELIEGESNSKININLTFTEEKKYTIYFKDSLGNVYEKTFVPEKLDQTGPSITLNKKDEWGTSETITIKTNDAKSGVKEIKVTKEGKDVYTDTLNEVQKEYTYELEVEENGTYEVEITDAVGNKTTDNIMIDKIDKENPTVSFEVKIEGEKVIVTAHGEDNNRVVKYYYQVDEEEEVEQEGNTYTYEGIKDGIHTFKVRVEDETGNNGEQIKENVEIYYERKIEIIGLNGTIQGGKTLTNIVKNGSFENGLKDWDAFKANVNVIQIEHYDGSHAIKFEKTDYMSIIEQNISSPILNHMYYGSMMFKSPSGLTSGDNRYHIWSVEDIKGLLDFGNKRDTNGVWQRLSEANTIKFDQYLNQQWLIRNFLVEPTMESYGDNMFIVDLTEAFGEGMEPTKEWMDEKIDYFENKASYFEQTIKSNENINVTINPEPNYIFENVECDHAKVTNDGNQYTITNPTKDTICKIKYRVEEVDVTIESETSEITGGKTLTNIVKNGGFENGLQNWNAAHITVVQNEHYDGNHSIKYEKTDFTSTIEQNISTPILNHKYYGSMMFKSPSGFTSGDNRYQIWAADDDAGLIGFGNKRDTNGEWQRLSEIHNIFSDKFLNQQWLIRNMLVQPTMDSYGDSMYIVDLTESFGEGNEPNSEWFNKYTTFFETTANLYQDKSYKGGEISIPITIQSGYSYEDISCTNSESTYENGYLKITNITGEVICHLNTKDTGSPTASIKSVTVKDKSITIDASTSKDNESDIKTYYYSLDNGKTWQSSTTSSYTFTNVTDENYIISVKVKDYVENESGVSTYSK